MENELTDTITQMDYILGIGGSLLHVLYIVVVALFLWWIYKEVGKVVTNTNLILKELRKEKPNGR